MFLKCNVLTEQLLGAGRVDAVAQAAAHVATVTAVLVAPLSEQESDLLLLPTVPVVAFPVISFG